MNSCLVIVNPAAGRARGKWVAGVVAALQAGGMQTEILTTHGPGDATARLLARDTLPPLVIAAGGDGTINEVLNGIGGRDVALGLIPAGTTNVLAAELGYPSRAADIAGLLLAGRERSVHFGTVNDSGGRRRFAMMVGVGYDAWVVAGVSAGRKKTLGKLAYVLSMFAQLRRVGSRRYRLVCDGIAHDVCSAIITNGVHYAGHYVLTRQADISQPRLSVVLIDHVPRRSFFGMLWLLPFGLVEKLPFIRVVHATDIRVETDAHADPDPVQADGDVVGTLPVVVTAERHATRVIVP